jgi:cytochrome c-type biogenesis protein CcmH
MRTLRLLLLALLAALILGATVLPAEAQTPTPNQINEVARDLWCPLCNGVRLDNCELQACVQMREVISEQLAAGVSKDQIKAYFVTQYGDVVLGAPSTQGFNLLVWLLPALAVLVGAGWLAYFVSTNRRRAAPAPAPTAPDRGPSADDEYMQRVEDELKQSE